MGLKSIRFDRCRIHVESREILLDGTTQVVEPKPFDVLVYLIEHRQRVVSKDELLDAMWPNEFMSGTVVARAVMKARQAIGDDGKTPRLIKTVHRTGYRFTGTVLTDEAEAVAAALLSVLSPPLIAVLPFENLTGQSNFDWIDLGLMSMTVDALSADPRVRVSPIRDLLGVLEPLHAHASAKEREQAVRQALGVQHVVHVGVGCSAAGYWLDYEVTPLLGRNRLSGIELTRLSDQLAVAVVQRVCNIVDISTQERPTGHAFVTQA